LQLSTNYNFEINHVNNLEGVEKEKFISYINNTVLNENNNCNILNLTKNELAFLFCFNNSICFLNKLNTIENIKNNVLKFNLPEDFFKLDQIKGYGGVYCFISNDGTDCYIGSTKNLYTRLRYEHYNRALNPNSDRHNKFYNIVLEKG
jgi:GIY-YIG catalytic domain